MENQEPRATGDSLPMWSNAPIGQFQWTPIVFLHQPALHLQLAVKEQWNSHLNLNPFLILVRRELRFAMWRRDLLSKVIDYSISLEDFAREPSNSSHADLATDHFTLEPRTVTRRLWEPIAKESVQRPSQHTSKIMECGHGPSSVVWSHMWPRPQSNAIW